MPIKLLAMEIRVRCWVPVAILSAFLLAGCEGFNRGQTAAQIYEESMRNSTRKSTDIKDIGVPIAPGAQLNGAAIKVGGSLHVNFLCAKPFKQVQQFYEKELKGEVSKQGDLTVIRGKNREGQTTYVMLTQLPDEVNISVTLYDLGAEPEEKAR